jgi:Uma2 family endonuclease
MVQAAPIKQRITAQEYLEQYPETVQHMELIDGEVIMPPAPLDPHQDVTGRIFYAVMGMVLKRGLGEVRISPSDVHLSTVDVVQPDVFFVSKDNTGCSIGEDHYWHGAPDLCVEVLSSSTARRDRDSKFKLCQKHGVHEYWLVDPDAQFIEVYVLTDGAFKQAGIYGKGESFTSAVLPQLTLKLDVNDCLIFPG